MNDKMLRVKEVMEISGYSLNKSYGIIKDIKKKYKLKYPEAFVPEKIFKEYLGLDKV
ncbi:hypothetical protein I6E17_02150 [Fusobacterium perfoetens]|uniref:hypothetical protein n=1 Tax=Fusobacterium perfoetens TaxID=852 RepID=UPI001F3D6904|nr:hypothetical protein [Fusobacterium perfoetens]MCF2624978.1 hypothetical protein [Fusobacterium perfoetens]